KVWDARTGRELFTFTRPDPAETVFRAALGPEGEHLATASQIPGDRTWTVKVRHIRTGRERSLCKGAVDHIAFSPDGEHLAVGSAFAGDQSQPRTVTLWDVHTGRELLSLKAYSNFLRLAFSPDGQRLAVANVTGRPGITGDEQMRSVRVWDLR